MSPAADLEVQRVLDAVRLIVRELRMSERAAETRVGLGAAQLFVLQHLATAGTLTMGELATRTRTDASSVSSVVKRLAEQQLVARQRSTLDERRVEISLLPSGRKLLAEAPEVVQHRLVAALEKMPAARRKQLAGLLGELVQDMGIEAGSAPMFFVNEPVIAVKAQARGRTAGRRKNVR
jgi:DNA-binding MarR family transcriptional regulator